jgi:hypothetical protein
VGLKRRALGWLAVGLVVSAAALGLAFFRVRFAGGWRVEPRVSGAALKAALVGVRLGWLSAYALVNVMTLVLRALQLCALARRRDATAPRFYACYQAVAVAMAAQNLLPARLGEALRVVTLARADDVAPASATGAVVFGRVLDLVALLAAVSLPLVAFDLPAAHAHRLQDLATIALVLALLAIAALTLLYRRRERLTARATQRWPRFGPIARGFFDGLSALADRRRLTMAALVSLATPLTLAASYACALHAFGLGGLPAGTALVLAAAVLCAIAVPSAPSSLGVYHAAATWTLVALGAPAASAAAFALATHAVSVVSFVAIGAVALVQLGGRGWFRAPDV